MIRPSRYSKVRKEVVASAVFIGLIHQLQPELEQFLDRNDVVALVARLGPQLEPTDAHPPR